MVAARSCSVKRISQSEEWPRYPFGNRDGKRSTNMTSHNAELRAFAHPGYAGDKPNCRPPTIATTVQAGTVLTGTTEELMR